MGAHPHACIRSLLFAIACLFVSCCGGRAQFSLPRLDHTFHSQSLAEIHRAHDRRWKDRLAHTLKTPLKFLLGVTPVSSYTLIAPGLRSAHPKPSRAQKNSVPIMKIDGSRKESQEYQPGLSRRGILSALGASIASLSVPVNAKDLNTALAVAPLFAMQSYLAQIDRVLCDDLFQQTPDSLGIKTETGKTIKFMASQLLEQKPFQVCDFAASNGLKGKCLSERAAKLVRRCGKEVEEKLYSIVTLTSPYDKDSLLNEVPYMWKNSVSFEHRAIVAAQNAIDAAYSCFREDERRSAASLAVRAYGVQPQFLPYRPPFSMAELHERYVYNQARDSLILAKIDSLPPLPPVLFKRDQMDKNDQAYRLANGIKRGDPRDVPRAGSGVAIDEQ